MFALADCNNFFVSCERVFRPDLEKIPVIVLSGNDGCIIARSNEVKVLGIPMGAPRFKFEHLIRTYKIKTFSSNFSLYHDLSKRFMKCLKSFSPHVEIYSVDEAFLNYDNLSKEWHQLGKEMKHTIHQWLGLPISVGFAPTKTLAKIANRLAKKSRAGVWVLESQDMIENTLENTPVEDIWGVGQQWSQKLRCKGIYAALDLRNVDPRWMRKAFSVVGERLVRELQRYINKVPPSRTR